MSIGDANGCVYPIEFIVNPAVPLTVNIENPNNFNGFWVDCNGGNSGDANGVVEGGQPGYTMLGVIHLMVQTIQI